MNMLKKQSECEQFKLTAKELNIPQQCYTCHAKLRRAPASVPSSCTLRINHNAHSVPEQTERESWRTLRQSARKTGSQPTIEWWRQTNESPTLQTEPKVVGPSYKATNWTARVWRAWVLYPVPTGPPMPTVKARSLKSRVDRGCARRLKNPGDSRGSCVCGANPSCEWYTFPSTPVCSWLVQNYQISALNSSRKITPIEKSWRRKKCNPLREILTPGRR